MMRPAVLAAFNSFTDRFEGYVPWMYLDVKQLVTIGRGNLIDPLVESGGIDLAFVHTDESPASKGEITDEFHHIKGLGEAGARGGHLYSKQFCQLHLTKESIDQLTLWRLQLDEKLIKQHYVDWDSYPAKVQLAVCSMMWAMGAGFPTFYPHFDVFMKAHNWSMCATECKISEVGNPGVAPRNMANRVLFVAASQATDDIDSV